MSVVILLAHLSCVVRKDTLLLHRRCGLSSSSHVCRSLFRFPHPKLRALCIAFLFNLPLLVVYNYAVANVALAAQPYAATKMTMSVANGAVLSRELLQTAGGPVQVSMLDVDLTNPSVCMGVVQAHDQLISPDETISSMANRTGALAGINGDYFEINGPGRPIAMVMRDGQLLQSPTYHHVLGVTPAGALTISVPSFSGRVITAYASHILNSVNIYNDAAKGGMVLITPALGAAITVKGYTVAYLRLMADTSDAFVVLSVQKNIVKLPALSDTYALIAGGSTGKWLASNLYADGEIMLTRHISPDDNLMQAIGGGPQIVRNGALYHDPDQPNPHMLTTRNPLTAVAITRDGTHALFAVFDGRFADTKKSQGMTPVEAANYMLAHGAYQAMLFDGGGSSELVARLPGQHNVAVINAPSDGHERPVANGLFVYNMTGGARQTGHPSCVRKNAA